MSQKQSRYSIKYFDSIQFRSKEWIIESSDKPIPFKKRYILYDNFNHTFASDPVMLGSKEHTYLIQQLERINRNVHEEFFHYDVELRDYLDFPLPTSTGLIKYDN